MFILIPFYCISCSKNSHFFATRNCISIFPGIFNIQLLGLISGFQRKLVLASARVNLHVRAHPQVIYIASRLCREGSRFIGFLVPPPLSYLVSCKTETPQHIFNKGKKPRKMSPLRICLVLVTEESKLLHIRGNNCNWCRRNRRAIEEETVNFQNRV
jgi:hypothetical protein